MNTIKDERDSVPIEEFNKLKADYLKLKIDTDFAFATVEEFENTVGYTVNETFKDGWRMSRTLAKIFKE